MCEQQVFLVIFDPLKNKALQFSSEHQFGFSEAFTAVKSIRKSDAPENIEFYTNEDYDKLEQIDFRTLRRHNKPTYGADKQFEDDSAINFEDENLNENDTTSFGQQESIPKDTSGMVNDDKPTKETKLGKRSSARLNRKKVTEPGKAASDSASSNICS